MLTRPHPTAPHHTHRTHTPSCWPGKACGMQMHARLASDGLSQCDVIPNLLDTRYFEYDVPVKERKIKTSAVHALVSLAC